MRPALRVLFTLVILAISVPVGATNGGPEEEVAEEPPLALPQRAHNRPTTRRSDKGGSVKWTAGDNSGAHASAPRSKKYWDEHGLDKNKV
jgi:hypothetical protein